MFKVSQEIYLASSDSANLSNIYGTYKRSPDDESYDIDDQRKVFVAPEVTDIKKVQILHFPMNSVRINEMCEFIVKKNNAKGNIESQLISPCGIKTLLHLEPLDPDRVAVRVLPSEIGVYLIHIRFNGIEIPQSPMKFVAECDDSQQHNKKSIILIPTVPLLNPLFSLALPVFNSDANKINYRGLGIHSISLHDKNEFYVDASNAGNNILFIGICGPKGQCEEVGVKHLGQNNYHVTYRVQDPGQYLIAVKWGEEHIPGSPFSLQTK